LIGNAYAKLNDFDRAIRQYQTALEKNPRSIQPNMLIATLYDRRQEYEKANEYYEKVLEINNTFAPAANNLAWNIAQNGGNLDVALRWAEKAREYDQHNPGVADTLGWVMYKRGIFDRAIGLLKESSDGYRNKNPQVLYHLGMAYYRSGQRSQAREILSKALALGKFDGIDEAQKILSVIGG
jgi:tetratricopeptide (TPR) repeat protein